MFRGSLAIVVAVGFLTAGLALDRALAQVCEPCLEGQTMWPASDSWSGGFGNPGPRCGPVLEDIPHWNLYWFQCASRVENCDVIVPALMSQRPTWYAMSEFVPLMRDEQNTIPFATFGADADPGLVGAAALGTEDFDHEFVGGGRFAIGRQFGQWYRFEVSYLGAYSYSDDAAIRDLTGNSLAGTGVLTSPFTDFGMPEVAAFDFNNFVQLSIESEFNSLEFHLRRKIALPANGVEASFLIGGRYMQIDEQFGYRAESDDPGSLGFVNDVGVATDNKLIGLQLGMLFQFYQTSRAWIDLELKGGIYENMASQDTIYTNVDGLGATTVVAGSDDEMRTSFSGEILLAANYNFSRTLTLRMGYQATALTGVALAAENFQDNLSLLQLGPAEIDHDGEVVYHGPVIGITWVR